MGDKPKLSISSSIRTNADQSSELNWAEQYGGGAEGEGPEHYKMRPLHVAGTVMHLAVEYHVAMKNVYRDHNNS
jgi:hypothetical protein